MLKDDILGGLINGKGWSFAIVTIVRESIQFSGRRVVISQEEGIGSFHD